MFMNHQIIIFTPIFTVFIGFIVFTILKKRKRSAKSIYKLIDYSLLKNSIVNDLENNCQVYDFAIGSLENLKFN